MRPHTAIKIALLLLLEPGYVILQKENSG